jgi:hypothetical protein
VNARQDAQTCSVSERELAVVEGEVEEEGMEEGMEEELVEKRAMEEVMGNVVVAAELMEEVVVVEEVEPREVELQLRS